MVYVAAMAFGDLPAVSSKSFGTMLALWRSQFYWQAEEFGCRVFSNRSLAQELRNL
jgi:hypothetical protein